MVKAYVSAKKWIKKLICVGGTKWKLVFSREKHFVYKRKLNEIKHWNESNKLFIFNHAVKLGCLLMYWNVWTKYTR